MPASLIWGKRFRFEDTVTPLGEKYLHVLGEDGGSTMLSWSSVEEMQSAAEGLGVSRELWPVYPDCEVESEVPIHDAETRSIELRAALDPLAVDASYWLHFVARLLREGHAFFIMA